MVAQTSGDLQRLKEEGLRSLYPPQTKITVGMATCGLASGAGEVFSALQDEVGKYDSQIILSKTGCMGSCWQEPLVNIFKPGWPRIIYSQVGPEQVNEIVGALAAGKIIPGYALCQVAGETNLVEDTVTPYPLTALPDGLQQVPRYEHLPFFALQHRRVLRNCGLIDPENINEYIARGGYHVLNQVLTRQSPEQVIAEVTKSGLRGLGGAGFPTGKKWAFCRQSQGEPKYIICNADEGNPAEFGDRVVLEGDPHSVIEGLVIGAYAIGARYGFIYIREEYPLATERLEIALKQAQDYGFLGENILGSGFHFSIQIERGSRSYVAGEEMALMASVEGLGAEPSQRPPYPAQRGLWGSPTNINNVRTLASVPLIVSRGAEWFSSIGTARSKGTMVFSLVGKVKDTGLVEVPMGTTLRSLIFDIGGGLADGKGLKAVHMGGPLGGSIPSRLLDLPVAFETLADAGFAVGSGGVVVLDEDDCMVDVAKHYISFNMEESCGKCVPCREGLRRIYEILTDITEGRGQEGDVELLEDMGRTIIDSAFCGLGVGAPNTVIATVRYFADEYRAHITEKRCPASRCQALRKAS